MTMSWRNSVRRGSALDSLPRPDAAPAKAGACIFQIYSAHGVITRAFHAIAIRFRSFRCDLSRQGVHRDSGGINPGGIASDCGPDGMGFQRLHIGVCDLRNSQRPARRHHRTEKSADANCPVVVGIHDGDRRSLELHFAPRIPLSIRSRRSRGISECISKFFTMVSNQGARAGAWHHFHGHAARRRIGSTDGRRSHCSDWMAGELLGFWNSRSVLGNPVVAMVPRRSCQPSRSQCGRAPDDPIRPGCRRRSSKN
jgi:hypothetical protein